MREDPLEKITPATEILEILGGSNSGYNNYLNHESGGASDRVLRYIARQYVFKNNPKYAQFIHLIPKLKAQDLRNISTEGGDIELYLRYLDHKGKPSVLEEVSHQMLTSVFR